MTRRGDTKVDVDEFMAQLDTYLTEIKLALKGIESVAHEWMEGGDPDGQRRGPGRPPGASH